MHTMMQNGLTTLIVKSTQHGRSTSEHLSSDALAMPQRSNTQGVIQIGKLPTAGSHFIIAVHRLHVYRISWVVSSLAIVVGSRYSWLPCNITDHDGPSLSIGYQPF